jgi:hypothetical protein
MESEKNALAEDQRSSALFIGRANGQGSLHIKHRMRTDFNRYASRVILDFARRNRTHVQDASATPRAAKFQEFEGRTSFTMLISQESDGCRPANQPLDQRCSIRSDGPFGALAQGF